MKARCAFLGVLLVVSGVTMGMVGVVLRYAVLLPRGVHQDVPVIVLPLRMVKEALSGASGTEEAAGSVLVISDDWSDTTNLDADLFCQTGMTVFDVGSRRIASDTFPECTLVELISKRTYGIVVIDLGRQAAAYPAKSIGRAYQSLVDVVRSYQEEAQIWLLAVEGQPEINEQLRQISQCEGVYYHEDMER